MPVLDRTGLTSRFDFDLEWSDDPRQPNVVALQQALRDQLGLELVPGRESVEMLLVEKAR